MTVAHSPPMSPVFSPTKGWDRASWMPPSPPATVHSDCTSEDLESSYTGHAVATSFMRDLYELRTKAGGLPVPASHTPAVEVLDISRHVNRPQDLTARVELPRAVRHLRLKNTNIDIPRYIRADASVESIVFFTELRANGRAADCAPPCDADELVLNLAYPPQSCRLDAFSDFKVGHVTVILSSATGSCGGPNRAFLQDLRTLIAAVALQRDTSMSSGPVCTIVGDDVAAVDWYADRTAHHAVHRYLASVDNQVPANLVEIIDLEMYRNRVGDDVFKLHTVW